MDFQFNFGKLAATVPQRPKGGSGVFRIAVLGDFSGRANRGQLEIGAELARRKPIRIDADNIDRVLASFAATLRLPAGAGGGALEVSPRSIDDLHPDALYENLPVFAQLADLRQRLDNPRTFQRAADQVAAWTADASPPPAAARRRRARGSALRVDARLGDFARLVGEPTVGLDAPSPADELVKSLVAPYIVAAERPGREAFTALVDRALTGTMKAVLHHPDFQALESAWRALDFLVRRIDTSARLQIVVYDVSAEEFAADLSATDALEETGLYQLLVEQPALDASHGALSTLIGHYQFEMTPPHAELLGRVARIAAAAGAPFISAIGPDCISAGIEDIHPMVLEAWEALRGLPEADFVALTVPRFLLRTPYGARSEPVESFDFEEFDAHAGLKTLLWGNAAVLAAVLLARNHQRQGKGMDVRALLAVEDLPYFHYRDADGETVALPCAERLLTEAKALHVTGQGFLPVLATRGRPAVRLAGFHALTGNTLAGPWATSGQTRRSVADAAAAAPVAEPLAVEEPAADGDEPGSSASAFADEAIELSPAPAEPDDSTAADELDALLRELDGDGAEEPAPDQEMDPELAALLADL